MSSEHSEKSGVKQKLAHEAREMAWIFSYLALFLCAMATYSTLLLDEFHVSYFAYGAALLNALVMSKVVLIGEYARVGRKHEGKPLVVVATIKALLFSVLMACFHVLEEVVKHLLHGLGIADALRELAAGGLTEVLVRNLVIFCGFIPFFAFRELRRILGEDKFFDLFIRKGASALTP